MIYETFKPALLIGLIGSIALSGYGANISNTSDTSSPSTICVNEDTENKTTVSATESVSTIPNMAELDISVKSYVNTAEKAQDE